MNGLKPIPRPVVERDPVPRPRSRPIQAGPAPRLPRPGGWLRFEQGRLGPEQLLRNLETAVSLLQTGSAGLKAIDAALSDLVAELSAHWEEREHFTRPPEALGALLSRKLSTVEELARTTRFHGRGLLDGRSGVVGHGRGVLFVRGGPHTASSPPEGYSVVITALPTRAAITGGVPVHESWIWAEREIFLAEGERFLRYVPGGAETVSEFLDNLQRAVRASGLDLEVGLTPERQLLVRHTQYGSQFKFKGSSRTTPLLSKRPGKLEWSRKGRDIQGTLGGEPAFGIGRLLVGYLDNPHTSELAVCWRGGRGEPAPARVHVVQNGIGFQDGEDPDAGGMRISLPSFHPAHVGRWVDTRSGFTSLAQVRAGTWQEVLDTVYVLLSVMGEVDEWSDRLRAWSERYQTRALHCLRQAVPPPAAPPGAAGARDTAEAMASLLRRHIHAGPEAGG